MYICRYLGMSDNIQYIGGYSGKSQNIQYKSRYSDMSSNIQYIRGYSGISDNIQYILKTPNIFNEDPNFSSNWPQYFHLGSHTFRFKSPIFIGDTKIFIGELLSPHFFLNPNFHWRSPLKILGVSNEKFCVSNQNCVR